MDLLINTIKLLKNNKKNNYKNNNTVKYLGAYCFNETESFHH